MKQTKQLLTLAAALLSTLWLTGCGHSATEQEADTTAVDSAAGENTANQADEATPVVTWQSVIEDYLVAHVNKDMRQKWLLLAPCYTIIAIDSSDGNNYRVWGNWWVYAYDHVDTKLITSMAEGFPGLFHLKKTTDGFEVKQFDLVEEGRAIDENVERIFGQYADAYWEANANQERNDSVRCVMMSEYVRKNGLPYTELELESGEPAVKL